MRSAIIVQHPADSTRMVIVGIGVQKLLPEQEELRKKFPDHTITVKQKESLLYTNHLAWESALQVEKKVPAGLRTSRWVSEEVATTELLVSADEMSKENPLPEGAVYAVVPAHMALLPEERLRYVTDTSLIGVNRTDVEKRTTSTSFAIRTANNERAFDLRLPPLLCYRYTTDIQAALDTSQSQPTEADTIACPTEECCEELVDECHHCYMNDIALMLVEREHALDIQNILVNMQKERVEKIRRIKSRSHLEKLCRRRHEVMIGGAHGHLIRLPIDRLTKKDKSGGGYALHLPFVLSSRDNEGNRQ